MDPVFLCSFSTKLRIIRYSTAAAAATITVSVLVSLLRWKDPSAGWVEDYRSFPPQRTSSSIPVAQLSLSLMFIKKPHRYYRERKLCLFIDPHYIYLPSESGPIREGSFSHGVLRFMHHALLVLRLSIKQESSFIQFFSSILQFFFFFALRIESGLLPSDDRLPKRKRE